MDALNQAIADTKASADAATQRLDTLNAAVKAVSAHVADLQAQLAAVPNSDAAVAALAVVKKELDDATARDVADQPAPAAPAAPSA
jgi:hypothetical protein